ncbi:Undecaprenyl pyrophosphate synthase [Gemmatirosa kalamazoonensis]|uniref:Isoprenyl transferase n=2 Tax=Gemmatirosa kalamazoonensis TaxID=861299 RepID=W0RDZ0_9BACT|nr:Undecaprenyl pyrophosphate synthase [Gemmatirosa kalamazoonensis]
MDGNGRWATRRALPRPAGHRAGARAVRRIVEAAPSLGVSMLTLYALSSDNLQRPAAEVTALLRLFAEYLERECRTLAERGVRLTVIGRRDRLPAPLVAAIERAESSTAGGTALALRLAIDYSARHEIQRAALDGTLASWPDVDLLVRTGGEQRLSDFLLWESAYAELWFTERLWPDVTARDLAAAIADFRRRDRRFGRISA